MTHGWPGSVIELLKTIGPLTDPTAHGGQAEDAFHLVLPSMPGYGFSGEPAELGWDPAASRSAWAELMHRLGYTRYVAQGGDVGAPVTDPMGRQAPEGLVGIHLNLLVAVLAGDTCRRNRSRNGRGRGGRDVQGERLRLLPGDGHAAADDRLRPAGFTRRPGRLDARPRHGQLLQDLPRLRRRRARGQSHPGQDRRQHHAVLADGHRQPRRPGRTGRTDKPWRSLASGQAPPAVSVPVGFTTFPGEIWAPRAAGSRRPTRTSPTSTRSTGAATSPHGKSRSSSQKRSERRSDPYASCERT